MNLAPDDSVDQARFAAFVQALGELGWAVGRNVQIDTRWGAGDGDRLRKYAEELSALTPDVMLATAATVGLLQQVTRTIPIVFVQVPDPVGSGYVTSLAHPGGNATGFMQYDFSLAAKWLELLKQIAPLPQCPFAGLHWSHYPGLEVHTPRLFPVLHPARVRGASPQSQHLDC
jgi:putative ABC transport system substrate-binding protein